MKKFILRSTNIGAFTTRGTGITPETYNNPEFVKAIRILAADREQTHPQSKLRYTAAQVTRLTTGARLKVHKDKNNEIPSWVRSMGTYMGGSLWVADPRGKTPIPEDILETLHLQGMLGKLVNRRNTWFQFDPTRDHGVQPITSGRMTSIALNTPKGWERVLRHEQQQELKHLGFVLLAPADTPTLEGECVPIPGDFGDGKSRKTPTLSPEQAEALGQHKREGHACKSPYCEDRVKADGPTRQHRTIPDDHKRTHIIHIDIFGP
eukprot:1110121-Amphidinium_carterae.1